MWLIDEKNATKIYNAIINNTNIHLSTDQTIRNIILKIRQCIAHNIRDKYELEILAEENNNRTIAIDESLFTHFNNRQVWVIGLIDTQSKDFRLVSSFTRDTSKLKKIVKKFVKSGNTIISDSWPGYNWISEPCLDIPILFITTAKDNLALGIYRHPTLSNYGLSLKVYLKVFIFLFLVNILIYFFVRLNGDIQYLKK